MTRWICCVDRHTCIVMRNRKAVALSLLQFAIFDTLHRVSVRNGKMLKSSQLCDEVYRGVAEPSDLNTIRVTIKVMNRKLKHLGLMVRGNNHKQNSFYQLVQL